MIRDRDMKKPSLVTKTNAIKRAARGGVVLTSQNNESLLERSRIVYGLSNFALSKSPAELRQAWRDASIAVGKSTQPLPNGGVKK